MSHCKDNLENIGHVREYFSQNADRNLTQLNLFSVVHMINEVY